MADSLRERPFDNFRVAITDPAFFLGCSNLLRFLRRTPFQVYVLLGGRRLGKTSTLRAIEWSLLDPNPISGEPLRAFPVFISMQVEQPEGLDHLRYLLIARLRETMERWRQLPSGSLREKYLQFLKQVVSFEVSFNFIAQLNVKVGVHNPALDHKLNHDDFRQALLKTFDELEDWQFEGVSFLIDETDFIVRRDWANDAWSYFRGLKDTDTALKPFLGFVLAGYRELKDYKQKVGSPLFDIAELEWLTLLTEVETQELVQLRARNEVISIPPNGVADIKVADIKVADIISWAGCHPYLTQQMLNVIFDDCLARKPISLKNIVHYLLHRHHHDFSTWWNADNKVDGLGDAERVVYRELMKHRIGTKESLAPSAFLSVGATGDALSTLAGSGVIHQLEEGHYAIGAKLFESWVLQQEAP